MTCGNGTTLAFTPEDEDQPESGIWLVNADGTNKRQLTDHSGWLQRPGPALTWSPDGDVIAHLRQVPFHGEPHEVVLLTATADDPDNPIGTERFIPPPRTEPATPSDSPVWYPIKIIWSPDGTYLLYFVGRGVLAVPIDTAGSPMVITDELDIRPLTGEEDVALSLHWAP